MPSPKTAPACKQRGDFPTPPWLVDAVVAATIPPVVPGAVATVLDPACGDGRFLAAAAAALATAGARPVLCGVDIDAGCVETARAALGPTARVEHDDALAMDWSGRRFDIVLGNPPFLSQMASSTSRGGASRHGGGPYADAAAEFLALAVRLARADGGRIGLVLPQSILASRDAATVRGEVDRLARRCWAWWSRGRPFAAQVHVCALVWERHGAEVAADPAPSWSHVVTSALDVPPLPALAAAGVLGTHARLTANFRDQYYGLVPAVVDDGPGPPLVTSGVVDPGRCEWGIRPVRFAGRRFARPTVRLDRLAEAMRRWADGLLVPKVLIANQTRIIEAVTDGDGRWLPGVPLITARPLAGEDPWAIAAVLTSPVASAWAWHRAGGTGLSADTVRLGPRWLAELPWPAGDVGPAVAALRAGDVEACGAAVSRAYRAGDAAVLRTWWSAALQKPGRGPVVAPPA